MCEDSLHKGDDEDDDDDDDDNDNNNNNNNNNNTCVDGIRALFITIVLFPLISLNYFSTICEV
jgi:hypothetical protein